MRLGFLALPLLLAACAPALLGVDLARLPDPQDWDPKPAPLEWWYASGWVGSYAFHFAFFKAYTPEGYRVGPLPLRWLAPGPFHAVHLALTDLRTGERRFLEEADFPGGGGYARPGPDLGLGGFRFRRAGPGFLLETPLLALDLYPLKPPVVHPPGYSGTAETGRMYYQSYTRLLAQGQVLGERAYGEAWADHQWGEQASGIAATWDWLALHLSDGTELMVYRVKDRGGRVVQTLGSRVDREGRARAVDLGMEPLEAYTAPSGRVYTLSWRLLGEGLDLGVEPLYREGEILSRSTRVAYWEGPIRAWGFLEGGRVEGRGMGEFVSGPWTP